MSAKSTTPVRYAEGTKVPVEQSAMEVEQLVRRFGAGQFARYWDTDKAVVEFVARDRRVRFAVQVPDPKTFEVKETPRYPLTKVQRDAKRQLLADAEFRRRWRSLLLQVKAKLDAVQGGDADFEREFLAHIVVSGTGRTVGDLVVPQLTAHYSENEGPRLLPHAKS